MIIYKLPKSYLLLRVLLPLRLDQGVDLLLVSFHILNWFIIYSEVPLIILHMRNKGPFIVPVLEEEGVLVGVQYVAAP